MRRFTSLLALTIIFALYSEASACINNLRSSGSGFDTFVNKAETHSLFFIFFEESISSIEENEDCREEFIDFPYLLIYAIQNKFEIPILEPQFIRSAERPIASLDIYKFLHTFLI